MMESSNTNLHLHLKSDHDLSIFKSNVPSSFTNKLAHTIHFSEHISVALKGIQYCNTFENYNSKHDRVALFDFMYLWKPHSLKNPSAQPKYGIYYNLSLKSGFYHDAPLFIERMNSKVKSARIKRLKNRNIFSYDDVTRKCNININGLGLALIIRGNAISLLGLSSLHNLDDEYVVIGKSKKNSYFLDGEEKKYFLPDDYKRWTSNAPHGGLAPFPVELNSNAIFDIYLNVLQSSIYGSKYCKLLKTLNSRAEVRVGERIYQEFQNLTFLPLSTQTLDVLSIEIKNQHDCKVKFLQGPVILFLQIKPTRLIL